MTRSFRPSDPVPQLLGLAEDEAVAAAAELGLVVRKLRPGKNVVAGNRVSNRVNLLIARGRVTEATIGQSVQAGLARIWRALQVSIPGVRDHLGVPELVVRPARPGYWLWSLLLPAVLRGKTDYEDDAAPAVLLRTAEGTEVLKRTGTNRTARRAAARFQRELDSLGAEDFRKRYRLRWGTSGHHT